jgi:hypothetical protein
MSELLDKLARLAKTAVGEMPMGGMPMGDPSMGGGMPMGDPMAGGMPPMGGGMPPVPTAEEIMAMQGGGMSGAMPMGDPMAPPPPPEMIPSGPSPEEIAVDQAQADAMSSMGGAISSMADLLAKNLATPSETIGNATDALMASPVGAELDPADIPPLMEGDAI